MAYLKHLNNYQEAINYLDDYKGRGRNDRVHWPKEVLEMPLLQLGQPDTEALKYYVDAATMRTNDVTTPRFLLKAGNHSLTI